MPRLSVLVPWVCELNSSPFETWSPVVVAFRRRLAACGLVPIFDRLPDHMASEPYGCTIIGRVCAVSEWDRGGMRLDCEVADSVICPQFSLLELSYRFELPSPDVITAEVDFVALPMRWKAEYNLESPEVSRILSPDGTSYGWINGMGFVE